MIRKHSKDRSKPNPFAKWPFVCTAGSNGCIDSPSACRNVALCAGNEPGPFSASQHFRSDSGLWYGLPCPTLPESIPLMPQEIPVRTGILSLRSFVRVLNILCLRETCLWGVNQVCQSWHTNCLLRPRSSEQQHESCEGHCRCMAILVGPLAYTKWVIFQG